VYNGLEPIKEATIAPKEGKNVLTYSKVKHALKENQKEA